MIVDNVQYVKRGPFGWINRNRIRTHDGTMWLTVPVFSKGKFYQKINEVEIDNSARWTEKHWKSIERNYSKAPFFNDYARELQAIYRQKWQMLNELNTHVIKALIKIVGIEIKTYTTSELCIEGKATDLIINMCNKVKADTYLSGIHGEDYLEKEKFTENGIKLIFQSFEHPNYEQCQPGEFIQNLSMIDFLFNVGPKAKEILCK